MQRVSSLIFVHSAKFPRTIDRGEIEIKETHVSQKAKAQKRNVSRWHKGIILMRSVPLTKNIRTKVKCLNYSCIGFLVSLDADQEHH